MTMSPDTHVIIELDATRHVATFKTELIELGIPYTLYQSTVVLYPCKYSNDVQKLGYAAARQYIIDLASKYGATYLVVDDVLNILKECLAAFRYLEHLGDPNLCTRIEKCLKDVSRLEQTV